MTAADTLETTVQDDPDTKNENHEGGLRGVLSSIFLGLVQDAVKFVFAFALGTGAGAIFCWYYGIPLIFSLLGGILVLGLALALSSDSLFS